MTILSAMAMDSPSRPPGFRRAPRNPGTGRAASQVLQAARSCGLATRFHAWTGRSGRRYVVSVHSRRDLPEFSDAVLIAVAIEEAGGLTLLDARTSEGGIAGWEALARADEVHVHLLARTAEGRRSVVRDLVGDLLKAEEPR